MEIIFAMTMAVMLVIFFQDLKYRAVYWWLFPILFVLLFVLIYAKLDAWAITKQYGFNMGFLVFQLLILTLYFSIKNKQLTNITQKYLGLGDILFLAVIAIYLSFLNFIFFYVMSLLLIVFLELLKGVFSRFSSKKIPLAGYQSLLLGGLMLSDQLWKNLDLTNDTWLLPFLNLV